MHRTRLVRVSFVLLFTTAFVSSAAAQPGLLRKLDPSGCTRALLATGRSHVIISAPDPTSLSYLTPFVQGAGVGDTVVVWGTSCSDPSCTPVIWNKS